VFKLLSALLLESKIVLCSKHRSLLTPVAEALRCFIWPFKWNYAYVPVLPMFLSGILEAPMPILVGVHTDNISEKLCALEEICVVDLDHDRVSYHSDQPQKMLPPALLKALKKDLDSSGVRSLQRFESISVPVSLDTLGSEFQNAPSYSSDSESKQNGQSSTAHQPEFSTRRVRASFVSFLVSFLGDFRSHLLFPIIKEREGHELSFDELFDRKAYLKSVPTLSREFLRDFVATQMFSGFVDEMTYSSERLQELEFFSSCYEYHSTLTGLSHKVKHRKAAPSLVDYLVDRRYQDMLYKIPAPDRSDLSEEYFEYPTFPKLDISLFRRPRPVHVKYLQDVSEERRSAIDFDKCFASHPSSHAKAKASNFHPISETFNSPSDWVKFLLRQIYSCWFILQEASISYHPNSEKAVLDLFVVLDKIVSTGIVPDEGIYRSVLILCGKFRKRREAQIVFETMKRFDVKPTAITYGAYASALAEGLGDVPEKSASVDSLHLSEADRNNGGDGALETESSKYMTGGASDVSSYSSFSLHRAISVLSLGDDAADTNSTLSLASLQRLRSLSDGMTLDSTGVPETGTATCEADGADASASGTASFHPVPPSGDTLSNDPCTTTGIEAAETLSRVDFAAPIAMSCFNVCDGCHTTLTETHTIGGFSDDDASFLTTCVRCYNNRFVPRLQVRYSIRMGDSDSSVDEEEEPEAASDCTTSTTAGDVSRGGAADQEEAKESTPSPSVIMISVPFLNPIILRNDLSHVSRALREDLASVDKFSRMHPILFWNLIWHFSNYDLPLDVFFPSGIRKMERLIPRYSYQNRVLTARDEETLEALRDLLRDGHFTRAMHLFLSKRKDTSPVSPPFTCRQTYEFKGQKENQAPPKPNGSIWTASMFDTLFDLRASTTDLPVVDMHSFSQKYATAVDLLDLQWRDHTKEIDKAPGELLLSIQTLFQTEPNAPRFG